jgi:hypothetical protein
LVGAGASQRVGDGLNLAGRYVAQKLKGEMDRLWANPTHSFVWDLGFQASLQVGKRGSDLVW